MVLGTVYFYAGQFAALISGGDVPNVPKTSPNAFHIQVALKAVFGFAGGVALVMVTMGGLKYINSLGNPQNIAKAKDTILYAIIGLVVCIMGYAIVGFVIGETT